MLPHTKNTSQKKRKTTERRLPLGSFHPSKENVMMPYLPQTETEIREMLSDIAVSGIDELFRDIPDSVRLKRPLELPEGKSEFEVVRELAGLAGKNRTDAVSFLGFGSYDHLIPSVVDHLVSRSEFYTSYTPYQAEMSQGILQAIFEFQSMITELTGLDVSNASLYDGHTAAVEAASMALQVSKKRDTILYSSTIHPFTKDVLHTHFHGMDVKLMSVDERGGVLGREDLERKLTDRVAGVIVQSPNVFGFLEEYSGLADVLHANGTLFVISANPLSLGLLKSPGEWGADIALGDVQPFGLSRYFGGPTAGYIAAREELLRRMPGRIVGRTLDRDGKRAFVLTLQAREQHIKRERATSNICSNQALAALAATVYMTVLGKTGIREAAEQNLQKAHYLCRRLVSETDAALLSERPFFNEFTLTLPGESGTDGGGTVSTVLNGMRKSGILAGVAAGRYFPQYPHCVTVAVTEKRTKPELDAYVNAFSAATGGKA